MNTSYTILLAPDSFKESMTAKEACIAMEKGIKQANSAIQCVHVPMADGGEGTMQSLIDATNGTIYTKRVIGPLGEEVEASYGITGDGNTAVIEMASASGIHLIPKAQRNPLKTTSYGTGELIKAALDHHVQNVIIGLGGSVTNDGGAGAAQALGVRLLDTAGNELDQGGGALAKLAKIDCSQLDPRISAVNVEAACDVTNPLCGKDGASHVFGPQKGATPEMVKQLDDSLRNYAKVIQTDLGKDILNLAGAGAAGGLGGGLAAFYQAALKPGIDIVIDHTGLREKIQLADMIWTGEGGIDFQTKYGKTPFGVAKAAKESNKPVIAFAGYVGEGIESLYSHIDAVFGILPKSVSLEEALTDGPENLARTAESVARVLQLKMKKG